MHIDKLKKINIGLKNRDITISIFLWHCNCRYDKAYELMKVIMLAYMYNFEERSEIYGRPKNDGFKS